MHFDKNEYMKLLTYILSNCYDKPHVGKTVISTALYFTDFNYYEIYGEPLTKETYLKSKKGIIPKTFQQDYRRDDRKKQAILQKGTPLPHGAAQILPEAASRHKIFK